MATTVTTYALGKWQHRKELDYQSVNTPIAGKRYNAYGVEFGSEYASEVRKPYMIEEDGNTVYIMYDDDSKGSAVIYRMQEI